MQYGKTLLHTNPKEAFSPKYLDGLKDGMWFSSNTLLNGIVNPEKTVITGVGRFLTTVGGASGAGGAGSGCTGGLGSSY